MAETTNATSSNQGSGNQKKGLFQLLNGRVFWGPAILMVLLIILGLAAPDAFAQGAAAALNWVLVNFNWFLVPVTFVAVLFCLWAAFSKFGNIRLGGPDAKPKMKTLTWFAVALCSGMGIGITYYATYQPLQMFHNPPEFLTNVVGGTEDALLVALRFSFLEWGLHPYALYTCAGVALAFAFYNARKRYRVSDGLYPLFGEKINGPFGDFIDSFSIFVMLGGLGGSTGLALMQIAQGTNYLFGVGNNMGGYLVIVIILAVIYILGSSTGLHKLLSWFGNINLWLYVAIMVFALIVINPAGILNIFWTGLGDYLQNFVGISLYLEPLANTGWVGNNNTYFFAFWMIYAPITGLFLVKLAYGRTLREFVLVNMIAPVLFVLFWFSVFGGGAVLFDSENAGMIMAKVEEMGSAMAWYALLDQLPLPQVTNFIAFIVVCLSIITLAESMTMSLASMSCKDYADTTGETQPPVVLCIFWGVVIAAVAYMLLFTGGLSSIQTTVIVFGLPTGVLLVLLMVSHVKAMYNRREYDVYYEEELRLEAEKAAAEAVGISPPSSLESAG